MKEEKELTETLTHFPTFSYLASDLEITEKRLDRPAYLLLEYRENRSLFAKCQYEYSKADILFLSNLALDTNDKAWFNALTSKF